MPRDHKATLSPCSMPDALKRRSFVLRNKIICRYISLILVENLLPIASRIYLQEVALGMRSFNFPSTFASCPSGKMLSIRYF